MVNTLPVSTVFIHSNPGVVHDVEGVYARPCARELLAVNVLDADESIYRNDFSVGVSAFGLEVD